MGTLTPFAGLRYAHLGTDAYTDSIGVRHDSDDANVWMFPLGLRYSADIKNGIWTIRPMAEAGYVWTFGDRDGTDKVSLGGASDAFGLDIADAGSWYGRLGVQASQRKLHLRSRLPVPARRQRTEQHLDRSRQIPLLIGKLCRK